MMKQFEGFVNGKRYTDEQEFYKATLEAMKTDHYEIHSSYKDIDTDETPKTDSLGTDIHRYTKEATDNNCDKETPKTGKNPSNTLEVMEFDLEPMFNTPYNELDSKIRSVEDEMDDWLEEFKKNYKDFDIEDVIMDYSIQLNTVEEASRDINDMISRLTKKYTETDAKRENAYKEIKDLQKKRAELMQTITDADASCKSLCVQKQFADKIQGYIKVFNNYLDEIRNTIDSQEIHEDAKSSDIKRPVERDFQSEFSEVLQALGKYLFGNK